MITNKLILIVDDDAITRYLIQGFLRDEENCTIKAVESARDCLAFIDHNNVDLIISDVIMDDVDGLELCKTLLSKEETSKIPVILSSIKDGIEITRKSRNYDNVKKVNQKPYDRNLLLSDLKEVLNF